MGAPKSAICQTFPVTFSFFYRGTNVSKKSKSGQYFYGQFFLKGKQHFSSLQLIWETCFTSQTYRYKIMSSRIIITAFKACYLQMPECLLHVPPCRCLARPLSPSPETQLQAEEVGVFTRENSAGHLLCHLHQPRSNCQRTCLNAQNGVGHLHSLLRRLEVEPMSTISQH